MSHRREGDLTAHDPGRSAEEGRPSPVPRDGRVARMAAEVRAGLLARPLPFLPCKYFYDDRGSALFERITHLPEYYQTRTEEALLEANAAEIVARARPRELCEIGSGSGRKIRLLLDAMHRQGWLERCVLLDINALFVRRATARIAREYPGTDVRAVVADFTLDLSGLGPGGNRLLLFFAGTIGNLHPGEVPGFLRRAARQLAEGDAFLVGLDLVKDEAVLHAAYNDAAGVTAEFNKNILRVINENLGASFDESGFEHVAFYDRENAWIEMRLRALRPMEIDVPAAGVKLLLHPGDEIRTELSCKYTCESFTSRLGGTGLVLEQWYTDPQQRFACALLRRTRDSA